MNRLLRAVLPFATPPAGEGLRIYGYIHEILRRQRRGEFDIWMQLRRITATGPRAQSSRLPELAVSALLLRHDWKGIMIGAALRVALVLYALSAHAQQIVVSQPDCVIFFSFTASGQTSPLAPNAGFSNLTNGCTTWNFSYANSGFSAVTLAFQSAPNVAGVAGSWTTFAGGTLISGINPNTNTTGTFTWIVGYNPWVRVALTAATGSGIVNGAIYGYRIPSAGSSSAATADVNLKDVGGVAIALGQTTMAASLPVAIASNQSAVPISGTVAATESGTWTVQPGNTANTTAWKVDASATTQPVSGTVAATQSGTWTVQPGNTANTTAWKVDGSAVTQPVSFSGNSTVVGPAASGAAPSGNPIQLVGLGSGVTGGALTSPTVCDQSAVITVTGGNTTEVVALTAARSIHVCSFSASISLAGSAQFVDGTGTNCGTGAGNLTGAYSIATGVTTSQGGGFGDIFKTRSARALCLTAVTGNITGVVSYSVY